MNSEQALAVFENYSIRRVRRSIRDVVFFRGGYRRGADSTAGLSGRQELLESAEEPFEEGGKSNGYRL